MDSVSTWSMKIAEEIAPDEVDLAPDIAEAYISGGKDREDLFRQEGTVQGAFGAGVDMALLPNVLDSIANIGPSLLSFFQNSQDALGGGYYFAGTISSTVSTLLVITDHKNREKKKETLPSENEQLAHFREEYEQFKQVSGSLRKELLDRGLDEDQADLISYRVLKVMLQDPADAAKFTEEVARAS
jgi:hypothetical protein